MNMVEQVTDYVKNYDEEVKGKVQFIMIMEDEKKK